LTTISRQILCKQAGRKNYVPSAPLIKEKSQGLIPDFVYSLSSKPVGLLLFLRVKKNIFTLKAGLRLTLYNVTMISNKEAII